MGKVLVLRTCDKNLQGHGGFQWPEKGPVECKDWNPSPTCGNGLHGLLWGVGNAGLMSRSADAVWMIVSVEESDIVKISVEKVKFPKGEVIYSGNHLGAMNLLFAEARKRPSADLKNATTATAGYYAHASTAGYSANASTAGNYAHASTAGYSAHASTAGYSAHASTAENYAHASAAGEYAHASTAGYYAHASTAGNSAHASTAGESAHASTAGESAHASTARNYAHASTAGNSAHASTAGNYAHASTAGNYAHASTAGNYATSACLGNNGQAKAGKNGRIILSYRTAKSKRDRTVVGYVGEKGIKADTWYCVKNGKLCRVK